MFYWLYTYFDINLLQYISVRSAIAFLISFILTMFLMPKFIKWAKSKTAKQPIYNLAPTAHQNKSGTVTMGGIVFVGTTIISTILSAKLNNIYIVGGVITILLFCLIGARDDYMKISKNLNQSGLSQGRKLTYQILASIIVVSLLFFINHTTTLYIPFIKNPIFDMGLFSVVFWIFVLIATSNAVNLTDGLDGLAVVPSIISFFTLVVLVYITGHALLSSYLLMPNIKLVGEVAILGSALIGSMIAFLWFNAHPAQIFMGDSGSLAIGGLMGYMAIISKSEILLIMIGFLFVMETISVIMQVGSFKLRRKRVFLMAPIHHHFEEKGWAENKIIVRFWIISFLTNLIALISIKIR